MHVYCLAVDSFLTVHCLLAHSEAVGVPIAFRESDEFGRGTGPIFLSEVHCVGTEEDLLSCPQLSLGIGVHKCDIGHSQDAGVHCPG